MSLHNLIADVDWGNAPQWFAAVAATVTLLLIWNREFRKRPRLTLSFDPAEDIATQGFTPDPITGNLISKSRWLRVRVINAMGVHAAKNAMAFLVGVRVDEPAGLKDPLHHDNRPLPWQNVEGYKKTGRTLYPGVAEWFDVLYTDAERDGFRSPSHPHFGITNPPGAYIVTVRVTADEVKVATLTLRVTWDGSWESLTATAEDDSDSANNRSNLKSRLADGAAWVAAYLRHK